MARRPRLQYPGAVFHVMARGNRKGTIFEADADRETFQELLAETVERYGLRAFGVCQMGTHYHLVIETPRGNLSDAMRFLNGVFAQRSNRRYGRSGHVFEARFRSLVIQREGYLRRALRYAVLNPVRAGLVHEAGDWLWSSYRATAGLEPAPTWLTLDWLEWAFDAEPGVDPHEQYRRYVNAPTARRVRVDTKALVVGDRAFRQRLAQTVGPRNPDRPLPVGYRAIARQSLGEVLCVETAGQERSRAAYAAHVVHGYRLSEIARQLKVDPSTVSKMLRKLRHGISLPLPERDSVSRPE